MRPLNRQDRPPRPGPEIEVLRIKAGATGQCIILSESLWGVWTHWNGRASEPCYSEKKDCSGCKRGYPKRWKGYLHVWDCFARREAFLELTPQSADHVLCQAGADSLRGYRFQFQRGKGDKARLTVTLLPSVQLQNMPEPKDPYKVLAYLWNIDELKVPAFSDAKTSLPISQAI
jgi:hypothetical protein